MGSGGLPVDAMATGCLVVELRGERFFVLSHFRVGLGIFMDHCSQKNPGRIFVLGGGREGQTGKQVKPGIPGKVTGFCYKKTKQCDLIGA
jgi:hypothetical protein